MKAYTSAVLILLLVSAGAVINAGADEPIVGTWSGTVYENNVGKYTVNIQINPGAQSGSVEFTRYPCGGTLSLMSRGGGKYLYQEQLIFGVEKCIQGLQVRLTYQGKDQVYFEELNRGTANVYGNLYLTSPRVLSGCIEDLKPFQDSAGFTVFRFFNHCDKNVLVSVCVKSLPPGDKAVFNPLSGTASPHSTLEIQGGMWRHFHSYQWAEDKIVTCPF
jgi:hypothetical protein